MAKPDRDVATAPNTRELEREREHERERERSGLARANAHEKPARHESPSHSEAADPQAVEEHAPVYGPSRRRSSRQALQDRNAPADAPCILVVDDDPPILELIRLILTSGGYRCIAASSGADAISLFQHNQAFVRLLITDLTMPGLDGAALIQALREIQPDLPCIGMSGSDIGSDTDLWRGQSIVHVEKPFTTRDLLNAVARVFPKTV